MVMNIQQLREAIFFGKKIGPERVMISPTDYCNLKCKTCWRLSKEEKYDQLEFEEIREILKECKKLKTKVIDFTGGGEPFFRKDMIKILKLSKDCGFFTTLTTNGTLLKKDDLEKLIELRLDDICFSLDGHDKKINDSIRGEGVYEKVIRTIKKFNELKKRHCSELPVVRMATVIVKTNYKFLEKIVKLASKLNVKAINFSVLLEWKTNKELWMRNENKKVVEKSILKAIEACKKFNIHSNLLSILKYGLFEHEKPKFCFAPWSMAFINASGDVMICCTLASLYENIVGNVKEESFASIWFGKKMEAFRRKVRNGYLPNECEKCIPEFTEIYNNTYEKLKNFNS